MAKFHIGKDGKPAECHATTRPCPLGGASGIDKHFASSYDAQKYIDEKNRQQYMEDTDSPYFTNIEASYTPDEFAKIEKKFAKRKTEIKKEMKEWLKKEYGLEMDFPVRFKSTKTNKAGQMSFVMNRYTGEIKAKGMFIDAQSVYYDVISGNNTTLATVKHEAIHYALAMKGKPFRDGEPEFESELAKQHAESSNATPAYLRKASAGTGYAQVVDYIEQLDSDGNKLGSYRKAHSTTDARKEFLAQVNGNLVPIHEVKRTVSVFYTERNPDYKEQP